MDFRKAAFQANSALWGIEANARVMLAFITQGKSGTDVALVSGYLGVRRNRRDLSWPVARRRVLGHEGRTREAIAMPLDPSVPMDAPPILAEYSSLPAESLRPIGTEHGFWYELPEGDIGSAGTVDCVFGERMPGAGPAPKSGIVQPAEVMLRLDMPVEHVLMEVFVDRDIPLAGRLFRSDVDQKIKKNLIIFVTARLKDAQGQPLIETDEAEEIVDPLGLPEDLPGPRVETRSLGK
jgi:hypothetical protein